MALQLVVTLMESDFMARLHPIKPPQRQHQRTEPMGVLCVGISRSGTESLCKALAILGYKPYHGFDTIANPGDMVAWDTAKRAKWDGHPVKLDADFYDTILGPYTAIVDAPAAHNAAELIAAYPHAKVIINTRDVGAWAKSYVDALVRPTLKASLNPLGRLFNGFGSMRFWMSRSGHAILALFRTRNAAGIEANMKWVYREHTAMVKGITEPGRLLEWRIGDGWGPLCEFLGKDVPNEDFPSGNTTAELQMRVGKMLKDAHRECWRNFIILGTIMFGLLAVGIGLWVRWA